MATVTKTIGATGRDYSTLTAWEADLDNDTPYDAGDDAVGECYDDADFDMQNDFTLDGGGTLGLNSVRLTVAEGERHDGTAGTGVRVYTSTTTKFRFVPIPINTDKYSLIIEWLELDGSDEGSGSEIITGNSQTSSSYVTMLRNCILHNTETRLINSTSKDIRIQNNLLYSCGINKNSYSTIGIYLRNSYTGCGFYNNTMHYIRSGSTNAAAKLTFLYNSQNQTNTRLINNLATGFDLPNTASEIKYGFFSSASKTPYSNTTRYKNNADETESAITYMLDGTVGSSACITGVSPANIYVSSTYGSEDLRLKDNTEILGSGADVGTSNNLSIDIEGYDRDDASAWDVGADQFVADTTTVGASFAMFVD
jgi:hypothetical protein